MQNDQENPLHDIHPGIAFVDLEEIDLEPFFGAPDRDIEAHIRSLANRASIGQLRQVMAISFEAEEKDRESLIEMYIAKKMKVVTKFKEVMNLK